ncbi:hypothetical protein ALC53_03384 [Atta colombica]|uniref:Uncharacterized protein n=1 Tax=Atta colombica TaxID=520822 RepID=A0A195BN79_9HYME|nr:hypothetical protein ALC53_03384 [Atta colombica]
MSASLAPVGNPGSWFWSLVRASTTDDTSGRVKRRQSDASHCEQVQPNKKCLTVSRSYDDKSLAIGGRNIIVRRVIAVARTLAEETTSNTSHSVENLCVRLTQFPSIILRIINPSVHDGLSRYQINFPSVKSQRRPHCLSEDWPARHRVYQQIEHSTRNYAHYAPRVARARERRHYTRKRVISVIISISAVPEISSSRSRYFRSVPCEGMRSETSATMMARLAEGAPDLIHYVSLLRGVYFI